MATNERQPQSVSEMLVEASTVVKATPGKKTTNLAEVRSMQAQHDAPKAAGIPVTHRNKRRVILYGDSGTLKTTTACQFPRPYVLQDAISEGAKYLAVPSASINGIDEFEREIGKAIADKAIDTLVLDDFDMMMDRWAAAAEDACRSFDKRQAYKPLYARVIPPLQRAMMSGLNIVITCHARKDQELGTGKDANFRAYVHPNLPQALETYLTGVFEVVGYTYNNGTPKSLVNESATDKRRIVGKARVGMVISTLAAKTGGIVELAQFTAEVLK